MVAPLTVPGQGRSRRRCELRATCLCLSRPRVAAGSPPCSRACGRSAPILRGPLLDPPQIPWTRSPAQDIHAPVAPSQALRLLPRALGLALAGEGVGNVLLAEGSAWAKARAQHGALRARAPEQVGPRPAPPPRWVTGSPAAPQEARSPCTSPPGAEAGGLGPAARSWSVGLCVCGQGPAGAQKGDTSCGPEGLGSPGQVRPQPPRPSQGRAKVSELVPGMGRGLPSAGRPAARLPGRRRNVLLLAEQSSFEPGPYLGPW